MSQVDAKASAVGAEDDHDPHADLILKGKPWTVMWAMSWPAVAAMMLWGLNAIMDAVFIGQLIGEQALAGAVMAYPLTQLTLGLGSLAGIGGGVALSIAIGRGERQLMRRLPGTTLAVAAGLSLIYAVLGAGFAESLVAGMGAEDELLPIAASYLRASALGGFGAIAGMALNMLLRGEGKMKLAATFMGTGLLVNIALTPVMILVFDLGVAGAAWATNIGVAVGGVLIWRRFARGRASYPVDTGYIGFHPELVRRILRLGAPAAIMSSMGVIQAIVVFNMLAQVGSQADIAFFGSAWRVLIFMLTPLFGLMRAFQPVAGINYGAGQWERVRESYWTFVLAGVLLILPLWLLMNLFPEQTLTLMLPMAGFSDLDLHRFRVLMLVLPVLPIVFTALALLPAIEQPGKATLVSVSRQLLFYVPVMLTLPRLIGVSGIYYGATAIDLICTLWLLLIVRRAFRQPGPPQPAPG
ncbi:MATE family efflux transporter [Wenzhouxiangella marina]|uniref:Multidrug transporter MatE n=1 Tax=Wenzhouxiangella marina TaxID=1579979 RepID=A0A0K0XXL7_9GAMM|nr:MATE family efflux transporter [Wenzhouxiangella marina]AKS42420.1 multidrug transporter MatE [Wenzhouxiangella marina]MBB6085806.1 putative MATE family efflux protein [Wenzhouxiangella marina]